MTRQSYASASIMVLLGLAAARPIASANPPTTAPNVWKGTIDIPGQKLDFVIRITTDASQPPQGTIDIPAQGAKGLALSDISVTQDRMQFTLPVSSAAVFDLKIEKDGKSAIGTMQQFGQSFPVTAERIDESKAADVGPPRPQTPKNPYPYKEINVKFENKKDGVTLAGTLTLPKRKGPHPAVILITGSGPQDRDETILGHKPFLVLADHLTRRGVAVLRYDDRGVGGSKTSMEKLINATTSDLANDTRAALAFLRSRKEIDPARIGLIGHSEGGVIAPMVAADDSQVACVVLLAGTGVPGSDVLAGQLELISIRSGIPRENVNRQLKAQKRWMELMADDADESQLREALRELVVAQLEAGGESPDDAKIDESLEAAMKGNTSAWMREFISLDPRESLRKVRCPVLALNGTLDTQVLPDANLPEIEKALKSGGNEQVTIRKMSGLNHLFQRAKTGLPAEYAMIEETFSPDALKVISKWLRTELRVAPTPKKSKPRKKQ